MTGEPNVQLPHGTTQSRILEAAILRFAQHSYEDTKLRDIARDAGVDVALVHRSFGSKERLFAEVVHAAFESRRLFSADRQHLSARLTARVLEPSLDLALRLVDPLDILIRNLLSREAIPLLRASLAKDVIEPLVPRVDDPSPQRAPLLAAWLAGIGILRDVLRAEALLAEFDSDLAPLVASVIDVIIGDARVVPCTSSSKTAAQLRRGRSSRGTSST